MKTKTAAEAGSTPVQPCLRHNTFSAVHEKETVGFPHNFLWASFVKTAHVLNEGEKWRCIMKTRMLLLLTGLAIAQTSFSAVATRGGSEPASKTKALSIALHRNPQFEKRFFQEIKDALDEAGHSTTIAWDPENLKGDHIDIGIAFAIGGSEGIDVLHNENRLMAKCIGNRLGRRTACQVSFQEWDEFPFMQPGDPVLFIFVNPDDIEKRCDRYVRGFVEGVEEYMDEI